MGSSDLRSFTRTYTASDDTFLSTTKDYGATVSQFIIATDAGTATFQASDGLIAHNITLTASVDHSGRTFTVVGVGLNGVTVSEAITGPNNSTVSGDVVFKSITEINTTGVGASDGMAVGIGRKFGIPPCRVRGYRVVYTSDGGNFTLKELSSGQTSTGELKMKLEMPSGIAAVDAETFPEKGIRFRNGIHGDLSTGLVSLTLWYE